MALMYISSVGTCGYLIWTYCNGKKTDLLKNKPPQEELLLMNRYKRVCITATKESAVNVFMHLKLIKKKLEFMFAIGALPQIRRPTSQRLGVKVDVALTQLL